MTLLDGPHLIAAFAASKGRAAMLVASDGGLANPEIRRMFDGCDANTRFVVPDQVFEGMATVETPSGILAAIPLPEEEGERAPLSDAILLDAVQDAGNVGTILRTAAAADFREVHAGPRTADCWSPRVLRAAMGAHFSLRIRVNANLATLANGASATVLATVPTGGVDLYDLDLVGPTVWIFGHEGAGVSAALLGFAHRVVQIPMARELDSLNVAMAAAICLFEQVRQRRAVRRR